MSCVKNWCFTVCPDPNEDEYNDTQSRGNIKRFILALLLALSYGAFMIARLTPSSRKWCSSNFDTNNSMFLKASCLVSENGIRGSIFLGTRPSLLAFYGVVQGFVVMVNFTMFAVWLRRRCVSYKPVYIIGFILFLLNLIWCTLGTLMLFAETEVNGMLMAAVIFSFPFWGFVFICFCTCFFKCCLKILCNYECSCKEGCIIRAI